MITAAAFTAGNANFTLVAPAHFPDTLRGSDTALLIVSFAPKTPGVDSAVLNIYGNGASVPYTISFSGVKDSIGFAVAGVNNDTINLGTFLCGTITDTVFSIENISGGDAACTIRPAGDTFFTFTPLFSRLAPRVGMQVSVLFSGDAPPGTHVDSVFITDTCGVAATVYCTAVVAGIAVTLAQSDTAICAGDSVTIAAPSGFSMYQWSNGATTPEIVITSPGEYFVTVRGSGGCIGTSNAVTVAVLPAPAPVIAVAGALALCPGDSVILSAPDSERAYRWSNGDTAQSIVVKDSGTYTVSVADSAGCAGVSPPVTVSVGDSLAPTITGLAAFCPGDSVSLSAGGGFSSYRWNTGDTTETITVTDSGVYRVRVTNDGCSGTSAAFKLSEYPVPIASITIHGDTLISSPAASYQWYRDSIMINGAMSQTYIATAAGYYSVAIRDSFGCRAESVVAPVNAQSDTAQICFEVPAEETGVQSPPAAYNTNKIVPNQSITENIDLFDIYPLVFDSIVFDLHYDATALYCDSIVSPFCAVTLQPLGVGSVHVRLYACGMSPYSSRICSATFLAMVSSADTACTALVMDNIHFYPAEMTLADSCVDSIIIVPACGLQGILYTDSISSLSQNYPNPFAGTTQIHVTLGKGDIAGAVLNVYNMLGERVANLTNQLSANGDITFAAGELSAGVYYYVLQTSGGRWGAGDVCGEIILTLE